MVHLSHTDGYVQGFTSETSTTIKTFLKCLSDMSHHEWQLVHVPLKLECSELSQKNASFHMLKSSFYFKSEFLSYLECSPISNDQRLRTISRLNNLIWDIITHKQTGLHNYCRVFLQNFYFCPALPWGSILLLSTDLHWQASSKDSYWDGVYWGVFSLLSIFCG